MGKISKIETDDIEEEEETDSEEGEMRKWTKGRFSRLMVAQEEDFMEEVGNRKKIRTTERNARRPNVRGYLEGCRKRSND